MSEITTLRPYAEHTATADCLHERDLRSQLQLVKSLLNTLHQQGHHHSHIEEHHPLLGMWRGYELNLTAYGLALHEARRFKSDDTEAWLMQHMVWAESGSMDPPWWLAYPEVHLGCKSYLLRSDYGFYSKKFKDVALDEPLFWWTH